MSPSTEVRAIAALLRYAFVGNSVMHAAERADEIAPGDQEAADLIAAVASWNAATHRD